MNGYSNGNGTTAASNNLNGSSSTRNGSSTSSNTQRSLLIIHKPSNTRLSIDGVPETLLGYAVDLKDEFLEHLNESGKGEKLVLEAAPKASADDEDDEQDEASASSSSSSSSNNAHLFLASYWLEFLSSPSKHEISLPILSSSRDYFLSHFMNKSTLDIHSIAGKLNDVDEKKLVLKSWFETCSKIGDGYYGPTGKIWDGKSDTNIYAVFGGQVSCSSLFYCRSLIFSLSLLDS